jgi:hypothetical protein
MTDNELIAEFMGYIYHEIADIDDSDCGGLYTRKDVYSRIPVLMDKYPNDDQFYLSDEWIVPNVDTYIVGPLKYDTSWNWLNPVIQKIDNMWDSVADQEDVEVGEAYGRVIMLSITVSIDVAYKAVVEFIKWYNQQHP